ncbi:hypothetical protein BDY24DRAFT_388888 [Mrakia frigida]|uniref:uncharacterized protein n=1 Tax=Mrakia frigida TaxID=29902 RepID=UPI003FCC0942
MAFKITMGSAEAQELQNSIQQELAKFEYAPEDDPVMAEYITVMLANNKTSDQITEELVDLVGDNYEPSFTTWLFSRASGEGVRSSVKAEEVDPSAEQQVEAALESDGRAPPPHLRQQNQGTMFAKALAGASSNPASATKRTRDDASPAGEGGEPLSKRRTSGGGGAGVPTGPRVGGGAGGKNLLDRMGGAQGNEIRNNQDAFQTKIDTLTQNSAQMGASLGMTPQQQQQQIVPSFPPRNHQQQHQQQQRGGMNMGGYGGGMGMNGMGGMGGYGGGMGMGVQEMMLAQMAQMQFMQQQMQQFAQQGGLLPQPQQQQQPFSGGPQRTNGGANRANHHNQAPRAGAGGRAPPKPYTPTLAKPTDPTLCKFSLGCQNAQCPYSHPSPVATPETALVLSTEPCELQRKCKDADCLKSHVSPASVSGHQGPSQLPCKYQNCNNPSCPFLHTDDQGNPIPPPALTDPSLAVPHTKKDPKFVSAPPASSSSKPWLKNGGGGGGFSPYSKSKPAGGAMSASGMNKSVKFNPEAKSFVPKSTTPSHISDRLTDQTEGGGEKVIPSASASSTPAPTPAVVDAAAVPEPEVKKEVEA